jgi:Ankyrin repeats (3 copies)
MKLTFNDLRKLGACEEGRDSFWSTFGNEAEIAPATVGRLLEHKIDLGWFVTRIYPPESDEIIRMWIAFDPCAKDNKGRTPLHLAATTGRVEVAKGLLADPRVDPVARDISDSTPLHLAACHGSSEIVEMLLANPRVDPTAKDNSESTPLHWAARYGRAEVAKKLLTDPRVNLDARDNADSTPMQVAASNDHFEVVKLLEEKMAAGKA